MREIKFRAWVKKGLPFGESGMCKVKDLIKIHNGIENIHSIYVEIEKEKSPYKDQDYWQIGKDDFDLMQYTGLKDKNGKEIYEGDLVLHGRLELEHPLQIKIGGYLPTEGDNGWGVHVHNEDETFVEGVSAFNQDNDLEVIGNIYENPELLVNEKK